MLRFAAQSPAQKHGAILRHGLAIFGIVPRNPSTLGASPLSNFGIKVIPKMIKVPYKQNEFPAIQYAGGAKASIQNNGSWILRGLEFKDRKPMPKWAIFSIDWRGQAGVTRDQQNRWNITQFTDRIRNYLDGADRTLIVAGQFQANSTKLKQELTAKIDADRKSVV